MHSGLGELKIVRVGKLKDRERLPVLRSHEEKRIGKYSGSELLQFDRERVLIFESNF